MLLQAERQNREETERVLKKTGMTAGRIAFGILSAMILLGLSFIILYPLLFMCSMAFRSTADISDPSVIWIPRHFTLQNLSDALRFMKYGETLKNTFSLGIVSSLLQIVSCALVGYGLARFRFRGRNLLFALVILTIVIPPQVLYTPTYLMYRQWNMINTPWPLWLPAMLGVGIKSGLFIYIFRQFYINLPAELEDAAYVDGCGQVRTFLSIIVPNAGVAFLTVFLFSLVFYWNDYYNVSMFLNGRQTVSTALANLSSAFLTDSQFESIMFNPYLASTRLQAGCLLAMAPLLLIYLVMQRFFVTGIERTGVVG